MTTEKGPSRASRRNPARRARAVVAALGAAAVLGLSGMMGFGDWRARTGDGAAVVQAAPKVAAGSASAPPLLENEPIRLKARRVVRTVTVRGAAPVSSAGVAGSTTTQPTAPVVTTGGSN